MCRTSSPEKPNQAPKSSVQFVKQIGVPLTDILVGPTEKDQASDDGASFDELQRRALESVQDLIQKGKFALRHKRLTSRLIAIKPDQDPPT